MFKIGYRTLKTAIGTAISIFLAQMFHLENYVSAGILTILCIQVTKKRSLISSWQRFAACIIGMLFSYLFFELGAYSPISIGLLLVTFIPVTVMLKIQEGVVTSSVIILHIYTNGEVTIPFLLNELGIIVIGIGIALVMNLYMPSLENKLGKLQKTIEDNFAVIFSEISLYLRNGDNQWVGKEITATADLIEEGKSLAFRNIENHFLRNEDEFYRYFVMREKQFEIIERLLPIVTSLSKDVKQGHMIADFIDEVGASINPGNTAILFLNRLNVLKEEFRDMPLPTSREEFEIRASLYNFVKEMEKYLMIKRQFKKSDI